MRALITCCSTGIGRSTALELSKRGYEVVASARRLETIAALEVGARITLDVDSNESVRAALTRGSDRRAHQQRRLWRRRRDRQGLEP
jgi:NADP-dependent 3-hydroxy acid dehydrogenase YdfG